MECYSYLFQKMLMPDYQKMYTSLMSFLEVFQV